MSSSIGNRVTITLFGQSHSQGVGVVIDGLPAGEPLDLEQIGAFMARRAPGGRLATKRREADRPQILSGLAQGRTCGAPLCCVIENTDVRSADYDELAAKPRPGHADYTAHVRYKGWNDLRGGGHFSARLTAPLCFAGGVALQLLERRGVTVGAHLASVYDVSDLPFDPAALTPERLREPASRELPVLSPEAGAAMAAAIEAARADLDSVGGVVECAALGLPAGLGDPIFDGLENRLAAMLFGIPAVKGVEFGAGFGAAAMRGSEHNDPFYYDGEAVRTRTNRHGGILGGISSGMPLVLRAAFKPTPSISREQQTVNLQRRTDDRLTVHGRHDPCVALRAVPCVEAATALALLDFMA